MFSRKPSSASLTDMKDSSAAQQAREGVISIIGPGMRVVGDCITEGTLRVEGTVEGTVTAGKALVLGKEGVVLGDVKTQDAVIGGRVVGTIVAESRLELQSTCLIEGEVYAKRMKLDEGGKVNGKIHMGETVPPKTAGSEKGAEASSDAKAVAAKA